MFGAMMIFQSMNYDKSISLNLKYQRFTITGCTEIEIRKFEFVAKTQFLYLIFSARLTFKQISFDDLIMEIQEIISKFHDNANDKFISLEKFLKSKSSQFLLLTGLSLPLL